ncbi:hypothetical protein P7B04_23670 [Sphingobium yanoikuyae]|uniref:hypothetical protein n=1 Tax=Sphingobium yanoikuyae TaxID=13690 RepID=UPI00240F6F1B|nr:hypothetical protein [Sphingobium yanoikuyae]MDG2515672.1 hypothetical protein [Sphingobium yanoikuyae]
MATSRRKATIGVIDVADVRDHRRRSSVGSGWLHADRACRRLEDVAERLHVDPELATKHFKHAVGLGDMAERARCQQLGVADGGKDLVAGDWGQVAADLREDRGGRKLAAFCKQGLEQLLIGVQVAGERRDGWAPGMGAGLILQ